MNGSPMPIAANENEGVTVKEAAGRPRPVLMMPLRRCGSHALRLRLNFNAAFYSPYPLHIVDMMPLVPLYGDLNDDQAYFQLVVDVIGLQNASMVKWKGVTFDPIEVFDDLKNQPRSIHRVAWELLLKAGERQHARIVMDKSLDNVHYADELSRLFPEMLFLNVVRDPRAQVASMNRAIIHDFDTVLNALTWVEAERAAQTVIQSCPERTLTIRYEDFLSDQESVLRAICTFFDIEFMPDMLDVTKSEEAGKIAKMSALWSSNFSAPILANREKFKAQLSMADIEVIETLARDAMQRYGYEFMTPAAAHIDEASIAAARERSAQARAQAWQDMKAENYRDFILRRVRADYLANLRVRLERDNHARSGLAHAA